MMIVVVALFLGFRNHYINEGIRRCEEKVRAAVDAETDRLGQVNEYLRTSSLRRARQLLEDKHALEIKLAESEVANEAEPDLECLSSARILRINAIRRDAPATDSSTDRSGTEGALRGDNERSWWQRTFSGETVEDGPGGIGDMR